MPGGLQSAILVVEDEAVVASELRRSLERMGYEVLAPVATASEAVSSARQWRPSLVLMDVSLEARLDGVEAAAVIGSPGGTVQSG